MMSMFPRMHTFSTRTLCQEYAPAFANDWAKLEQERADRARRDELADCNCPEMKSPVPFLAPVFPEALEAALNKTCPVHGLRRLGPITIFDFVNLDRTESERTTKLRKLIESHGLRLLQHSQSGAEPEEDESQEP